MSLRASVIGLCLGIALHGTASATPVTYTLSGTFGARLDGGPTGFGVGAITGTGDTDAVTFIGPGLQLNVLTTASFSIAGVGAGTITTPLLVFSTDTGVGLRETDPTITTDLLDLGGNLGRVMDLRTAFAITVYEFGGLSRQLATSAGNLGFFLGGSGIGAFTSAPTATPEPASLLLLAVGATAALGGLFRRACRG